MTTRTRLLCLLAIVGTLVLGLVVAGCGDDDAGGGGSSEDAKALLERALEKAATSGDVKFDVSATLDGVEELRGPLQLSVEGPYKQDSPKELPELDWDISAQGAGKSFDVGLVVTKDNAFVDYKGETYEVGTELFRQFAEQSEEQQEAFTPQGLKALGFDPADWLKDPEVKDGEDIGGDSTQLVTGGLNVERVIEDSFELLNSPALQRQLQQQGQAVPPFPEPTDAQVKEISDAVDRLIFEFNVDENDVGRRTLIEADFTVPKDADAGSLRGGSVKFEYVLEDVDIDPDIQAPSGAKPLSELIEQFGGLGGGLGPGGPPGGLQTP